MAVNTGRSPRGDMPRSKFNASCGGRRSTDPHVLIFTIMGVSTLISLLACLGTWNTSRAKKVRLMEDQVVSAVRAQRERADGVETKLAEWQVTITGMLAEVEEFFERSVKERKRATVAETRMNAAAGGNAGMPSFNELGRGDQIDAVRAHFQSQVK